MKFYQGYPLKIEIAEYDQSGQRNICFYRSDCFLFWIKFYAISIFNT